MGRCVNKCFFFLGFVLKNVLTKVGGSKIPYVIVEWSLKACSDCYNSVSACLELETKLSSKRGG